MAERKIVCVLLGFVSVLLILGNATDASAQVRTWTSSTGSKIEAALINVDDDKVTLSAEGRKEPLVVPIKKLSAADQSVALVELYDREDRRQYKLVVEHLRNLHSHPKTVQRLLVEFHKEFPNSPYAGLWGAVAHSVGSNNHDVASMLLKATISRIEKQRKHDPMRHSMTLASAHNNLGICYIKDRRSDSASTKFVDAFEVKNVALPVVRYNAQMLSELGAENSAMLRLSDSVRARMLRSLAFPEGVGSGIQFEDGWQYSLDFNLPRGMMGSEKSYGIDSPRPELTLLSQGTGFVIAPGIVLTSKKVIQTTNYNGPKLITIVTNPNESIWKSELA